MTTAPAPVSPSPSVWLQPWARLVRLVALLILVTAAGAAVLTVDPPSAHVQNLLQDVRSGRVDRVEIFAEGGQTRSLRWSTSWYRWWTASETDLSWPPTGEGAQRSVDLDATLRREARTAGRPLEITYSSDEDWPGNLPWDPLASAAVAIWFLTFVHMIVSRRRWLANGWAWLWLLLPPGAGSALYLLAEPGPLWRRAADIAPRPTRLSGVQGFVLAIVLGFVVSLVGYLIGRLVLADPRLFTGQYIEPVLVPE